jgi:hypothetical protein
MPTLTNNPVGFRLFFPRPMHPAYVALAVDAAEEVGREEYGQEDRGRWADAFEIDCHGPLSWRISKESNPDHARLWRPAAPMC